LKKRFEHGGAGNTLSSEAAKFEKKSSALKPCLTQRLKIAEKLKPCGFKPFPLPIVH
jgi:hypothetical protein